MGRRVPVESFDRVVDEGVEVCTAVYGWDVTQGLDLIETDALDVCSTANGIPDVTFRPDLSTLRRAAWLDGVAVCLADPYDPRRDEYLPLSPRTILKQQIARLKDLGLHAKTGTELEFYLFHNEPRELRDAGFHGLRPTTAIPRTSRSTRATPSNRSSGACVRRCTTPASKSKPPNRNGAPGSGR